MRTSLRLNQEVKDKLVTALRGGNYMETAAAWAGVNRATVYRWLERGDRAAEKHDAGETLTEQEQLFLDLRNEVDEARAAAMVRNISLIQQAAQTSWQAAAWWAERSAPHMWGRMVRTEVSGPNQGPLRVNVSMDDLETLVQNILTEDEDEDDASS